MIIELFDSGEWVYRCRCMECNNSVPIKSFTESLKTGLNARGFAWFKMVNNDLNCVCPLHLWELDISKVVSYKFPTYDDVINSVVYSCMPPVSRIPFLVKLKLLNLA